MQDDITQAFLQRHHQSSSEQMQQQPRRQQDVPQEGVVVHEVVGNVRVAQLAEEELDHKQHQLGTECCICSAGRLRSHFAR